jgi:hypothetical protein
MPHRRILPLAALLAGAALLASACSLTHLLAPDGEDRPPPTRASRAAGSPDRPGPPAPPCGW